MKKKDMEQKSLAKEKASQRSYCNGNTSHTAKKKKCHWSKDKHGLVNRIKNLE